MTISGSVDKFIARWTASSAHERRHKDHFFLDLCDALGVPRPDPADKSGDYCFERAVTIDTPDGRSTTGFIDFYRRGSFVWEAKQGSEAGDDVLGTARRGTALWDKAMRAAYGQALRYAAYLPEGKPPVLMTADIGNCFEVWSGFSGHYGGYGARHTIELSQLADASVRDFFIKVFVDPLDLDPARHAQRVTREVAAKLADLARDLEKSKHDPELVAQFLMRCLFTMFAEDVGLLPEKLFTRAVEERWQPEPRRFQHEVEQLWKAMNDGLPFGFEAKLLRFNGGLFKNCRSIPMTAEQLQLLLDAAKCDWSNVEPTIFGTLLERALDPFERQKLGAHFTPREYIERLVRPAVIEPLRAEWVIAQAQARQLVDKGDAEPTADDRKKAATAIRAFHDKLVQTRVLDPACGSGNFLFVTLDLFKQIEAEVLRELADLGVTQAAFELEGVMVNPGQFLGIEINPRAREIADLVLWIGYLQWYRRVHGDLRPAEPVLREYKNIVCRDAVLVYDDIRPRVDENSKPITTWDQRTFKTHPITGKEVPDEDARVPVLDYINARPAEWPEADFIVSNPPFIGNWLMRQALGDGYAETVRANYPDVPESCDFVMYWWEKAAVLARQGKVKRFGFITTNSLRQTFSRRVLARHLEGDPPLSLTFAIPDHPWVDSAEGAAVRIAMTVGEAGKRTGRLLTVKKEVETGDIAVVVIFDQKIGGLNADLTVGADVTQAVPLRSNENLSNPGVKLHGAGFIVTPEEAVKLGLGNVAGLERHIRLYLNGKDVMQKPRKVMVIDLFGLGSNEVRDKFPSAYQWVYERVKPERDTKADGGTKDSQQYARDWWLFGKPRPELRKALSGLRRYIATTETAKHRVFQFLDTSILPDNMLVNIALDDAYFLGIVSSRFHVTWSLISGGTLEDRPRYNKTRCFDPFPFPDAADDQKARIREVGERLDALRKCVQADHPDATLTGMYNALERLRQIEREGGPALTEKERAFHEKALVGVLKQLHDELDAAVADAYGWPVDLPDDELLARLVALNHERAEEEKRGIVRWLRPDFQNPTGKTAAVQPQLDGLSVPEKVATPTGPQPWPKSVPDQLKAIRDLLASRPGSWSVDDVAAAFKGARKTAVEKHLVTLAALGVLISNADKDEMRWGVLGHTIKKV
ncbi:MAG: class I SAM-dependent DNA methyltransferase [Myxococcales bacterium]|nr:class I SAM-dependent DNA methyltransferase [Myxococcales bacterium]